MMYHEEHITKMIKLDLKLLMFRSSIHSYSDSYIPVKGPTTVEYKAVQDQPNNTANENVTYKHCKPFINISRIDNTQVDGAHNINLVMSIYNVMEYSDNY